MLVFPVHLYSKHYLLRLENQFIIKTQARYSKFKADNADTFTLWAFEAYTDFSFFYSSTDFQVSLSLILFLVSDSLIAFKNLLVFLFGLYLFSLVKVFYKSERPFWSLGKIDTY